jgi:hypothetical protein
MRMEIREALTIVRKLADGVHPETGEVLQEDCLYNHPHAVHTSRDWRARVSGRAGAREKVPAGNVGKAWSNQEDAQICEELRRGMNLRADCANP